MKKSPLYIALPFLMLLIGTGCDRIDDPHPEVNTAFNLNLFPGEAEDYPYPVLDVSTNDLKNVLLEDFTGHKCVPCFAAGASAQLIEDNNPGRVFVTSIHASSTGLFQSVDAEHPTDFTTEAGDTYVNEMEGGGDNPLGTTNRILSDQSTGNFEVWQVEPFWNGNVTEQLQTTLDIDIQVAINYYPETDGVFVHSRVDFKNEMEGNFNLVHYIIRKEVISPQSKPGGIEEEYHHHNVLTDNIGGPWGISLTSGTTEAGFSQENQYSYQLPASTTDASFSGENIAIVSYVINRDTYEIMQVVFNSITE